MSVIEIKSNNESLIEGPGKKVIKFYASWCSPCMNVVGPMIESISKEYEDVKFFSVNVDEHLNLAEKFDVLKLPTVFVFNNDDFESGAVHLGPLNRQTYIDSINSL